MFVFLQFISSYMKEVNTRLKLLFSNSYIFTFWWFKSVIFQTMNMVTKSGCNNTGIRTFEFVTKAFFSSFWYYYQHYFIFLIYLKFVPKHMEIRFKLKFRWLTWLAQISRAGPSPCPSSSPSWQWWSCWPCRLLHACCSSQQPLKLIN